MTEQKREKSLNLMEREEGRKLGKLDLIHLEEEIRRKNNFRRRKIFQLMQMILEKSQPHIVGNVVKRNKVRLTTRGNEREREKGRGKGRVRGREIKWERVKMGWYDWDVV
jgi:hypothetical protein